ncbi:hypothetical protein ACIQ7D_17710 [Streptomyces sp. NPDC096310]|uniref:hypothetical protein n=1 Tax=Streptomyces sp. NPDC096310 TaxID=3366082 RepID=UPI0037FF0EB8
MIATLVAASPTILALLAGTAGLLITCTTIAVIVITRTALQTADTSDVPAVVRTICRAIEALRRGRRD